MLYIITAYNFNHLSRNVPIDARLLSLGDRAIFYFVDENGAPANFPGNAISEASYFPEMTSLGRNHLAEWTFLLSEYYKPFARYPFYMVSTRFYEKNARLRGDLNTYWDDMFSYLNHYGFGYLPSYNRRDNFISYQNYMETGVLGMKKEGIYLVNDLYNCDFLTDCNLFSDFFCNYIGFRSRADLEDYVSFYMKFLHVFFDDKFLLRQDYSKFVKETGGFRQEKPLTLILEMISHLFFFKKDLKFYGLHYDAHIEVDELRAKTKILKAHK
jgi:hypothetical protein